MQCSLQAAAAAGIFKPRRCGYVYDCPRNYTLSAVNESASTWVEGDPVHTAKLRQIAAAARETCSARERAELGQCSKFASDCSYMKHGGWCLEQKGQQLVELPNSQSYRVPRHHAMADGIVVSALAALLTGALAGTCRSGRIPLSINDFGAGVGQVRRARLEKGLASARRAR